MPSPTRPLSRRALSWTPEVCKLEFDKFLAVPIRFYSTLNCISVRFFNSITILNYHDYILKRIGTLYKINQIQTLTNSNNSNPFITQGKADLYRFTVLLTIPQVWATPLPPKGQQTSARVVYKPSRHELAHGWDVLTVLPT